MSININMHREFERYRYARKRVFDARNELSWQYKAVLSLAFALLTALAAHTRIYLGFTPVPITLQVFTALLAGVVLGKWWGGASMGMYVGMGAAGLPMFTTPGPETLMGVTGGYIIGFVVAAFVIGHIVDTYPRMREYVPLVALMLGGVGIIYLLGALQLGLMLSLTPAQAVLFGVVPFVAVDILKAVSAAAIAVAILPKKA